QAVCDATVQRLDDAGVDGGQFLSRHPTAAVVPVISRRVSLNEDFHPFASAAVAPQRANLLPLSRGIVRRFGSGFRGQAYTRAHSASPANWLRCSLSSTVLGVSEEPARLYQRRSAARDRGTSRC